MYTYTYIQGCT